MKVKVLIKCIFKAGNFIQIQTLRCEREAA